MLTLPLVIDALVVFTRRYETRIAESKRYLTESVILRVIPTASYEPFPELAFRILADYLDLQKNFPTKRDPVLNEKLKEIAKLESLDDLTLIHITEAGRYIVTASAREETIGSDVTSYFHNPNPFDFAKQFSDPVTTYLSYRQTATAHKVEVKQTFPEPGASGLRENDAIQNKFAPQLYEQLRQPLDLFIISALGVTSSEDKPIGVIAAASSGKEFEKKFLKEDSVYYPVRFAIVNPESVVVIATDSSLRLQHFKELSKQDIEIFLAHQSGLSVDILPLKPLQIIEHMQQNGLMRFMWQGKEQFAVMESMPWWEYSLIAYASKAAIFALPLYDFIGIFVSYTAILILGGILTYCLTKRWMRPVQTLGAVMLKVKEGDLSARYEQDRWGLRINVLGQIFNKMLDNLLSNREKAERERLQKELFAQELELGKEAQRRLLTEPIQDFGVLDIAQSYIPAHEVGGDFYDIFRKPNGKLVLAIADASGKGVLACCYSLAARDILRTLAIHYDDIGEVLFRGNNLFCADAGESGMFVTVELVQYDYEKHTLSYHSLGHNPGIICRKNGEIERLTSGDMAMGVLIKEKKITPAEKRLEVGDVIVLYTDGVSEMHNPESELFGEERLIETIRQNRARSSREIVEKIEEETKKFAHGRAQFDDFTLIVVGVNG